VSTVLCCGPILLRFRRANRDASVARGAAVVRRKSPEKRGFFLHVATALPWIVSCSKEMTKELK